jgi:GNAT superfamily N-acetyltransferase
MNALLRPACIDDIPAAAETFLAARRSILHIVPMVHPDESVGPWMRDVLFRTTEMWVAERDGRIAALMSLSPGWLEHLYGHPDFHGQGIGTALLAWAKRQPHAAGGLELWTFQGNSGARRFYERHGFAALEFTDGAGNEEKTADVRYEWRP